MSQRAYNFSAGPAALPLSVMQKAQAEFLNWQGVGASVFEISHRGKHFSELAQKIDHDFRALLNIPDSYHLLFLPGGSRTQFSMIPLNLLDDKHPVTSSVITGVWSKQAAEEADIIAPVDVLFDANTNHYTKIADQKDWQVAEKDTAYIHYCDNETVNGVEFDFAPESGDNALVCDMSSNIMSRPIDIDKYALIYACSQKNLGPAGVTAVIIHPDMLARKHQSLPSMLDYKKHIDKNSMLNTPVTFSWYMLSLILDWLKDQGGVKAMDELAKTRSQKLYDFIDNSDFYHNNIDPMCRSRMNVIFTLKDKNLEADFLKQAKEAGLIGLKGHRLLGGMRASIYNAMPMSGVDALLAFMQRFSD